MESDTSFKRVRPTRRDCYTIQVTARRKVSECIVRRIYWYLYEYSNDQSVEYFYRYVGESWWDKKKTCNVQFDYEIFVTGTAIARGKISGTRMHRERVSSRKTLIDLLKAWHICMNGLLYSTWDFNCTFLCLFFVFCARAHTGAVRLSLQMDTRSKDYCYYYYHFLHWKHCIRETKRPQT